MVFSHEAPVGLPLSAIHLDSRLFALPEADYKACARGHRAVGTNGGKEFIGMVNVETMAGARLIQHYRTELLEAGYVRLFSEKSRGYLGYLIPFSLTVGWEMEVTAVSATESKLRCIIDVRNPVWVRFVGLFNASNRWIRQHLVEETLGFAHDLTRKGQQYGVEESNGEEPVL